MSDSYEEVLNQILKNLSVIKIGNDEQLTAGYWKQVYNRDVQWLLKQLAEHKARQRAIGAAFSMLEKDIPTILEEASKNVINRVHSLLWPKAP